MCGITGKIYFSNSISTVSKDDIEHMNRTIVHRGPDDNGVWLSDNRKIGLGHQRLAILDLSSAGHQPMHYRHDGRKSTIVFNGEIYNFQEKRELLRRNGYVFNSNSDTEVILALYDYFGTECLEHLRGMFSFALYDHRKNILFCACDRLGKKPFKYYHNTHSFIFGSELKAILTQADYDRKPDATAINEYLTFQYCPAPLTGFKNISKLEPAHYMIVDCKSGAIEKKRYWRIDYNNQLSLPEAEWENRIIDKLEESVKMRMISDVPLGAFLSGGIDSSAIVALMAHNSDRPVKTFSIGFNESTHDERVYARMIAEKYKTDHTEFVVKPDAINILPALVKHYEEPYADSSALPSYYLAQTTCGHVTVALNGDGGDENFAGYRRHSIQKISSYYEKLRLLHKLVILPTTKMLSRAVKTSLTDRAFRIAHGLLEPHEQRYLNQVQFFSQHEKTNLYTKGFLARVANDNVAGFLATQFLSANTKNELDQMLYVDINTYLPGALLAKVDIATMAHSLESRSPFLDHEFMEMTAKIPFHLKLRGLNNNKYILKKALDNKLVPHEVLYRRKQGFGVPIEHWFRNELKGFTHKTLLSDKAIKRGIFKKEAIKNLLRAHESTKSNCAHRIWALLTLELWFQEYFD